MAEEGKSQKVVETYKAVAAGIAAVLTAVFTSKLGVAGTLIGTALTAISITLISAVLKVQLMKASDTITGLPNTVQGRLSTQQIRIPGKQGPEPNPEPEAQPEKASGGWFSSLLSRLRAMPGFLRDLPSAQRRKVLLGGIVAGLLAAAIGLVSVTGIELVGGKTLSCMVWSECSTASDTSSGESSGGLGLSILGGSSYTAPQSSPSNTPSVEQPSAPQNNQQVPRQPAEGPAQPDDYTPQQPGSPPQGEDPAQPKSKQDANPADQGMNKEDRGKPRSS